MKPLKYTSTTLGCHGSSGCDSLENAYLPNLTLPLPLGAYHASTPSQMLGVFDACVMTTPEQCSGN